MPIHLVRCRREDGMAFRIGLVFLAVFLLLRTAAMAQDLPPDQQLPPVASPTHRVDVGQLPVLDTTPAFNPDAATQQWLARLSPEARAKSDAYTEGGEVLQFVDLIYGLGVAALLLWLQISARIRDWAEELTRGRAWQVMLYAVVYVAAVTVLTLPLSIYEGYVREHDFGLSNQSFLQWAGDFATMFAVTLAGAVIFLPLLYAAIRAAQRTWWLWGAGLSILFMIFMLVIYPVAVAPLFNHYSALPETPLKQQILSLARANGVPADTVWVDDESRQSSRISANVSGFLGTTQITLNDNLLNQGTPDEVLAVVGHEMGHYVLGHTLRMVLLFGLVILVGFGFVALGFRYATDLFGGNWQVRQPDDVAGLPLIVALMSIFMFLATPVTNSITRTTEKEADLFGVNAVRKPDAFASVVLKLSPYRKLDPGPVEEAIFFDHPSGRNRIAMMMNWKAEHIRDPDIRDSVRDNPH
jgi:STE24 endopeptidase